MRPASAGVPCALLPPAALFASALLLAGCSAGDASSAGQPSGGATAPTSASLLQTGDCIRLVQSLTSSSQSLETADCAKSHHGEVVLAQDDYFSTSEELPGEDMLNATADQACSEAMYKYSKRKPEQTPFRMSYLYPTSETWAQGDRKLTCIAVGYNSELDSLIEVSGSIHAVQ